jgi:hypothetical protein
MCLDVQVFICPAVQLSRFHVSSVQLIGNPGVQIQSKVQVQVNDQISFTEFLMLRRKLQIYFCLFSDSFSSKFQ